MRRIVALIVLLVATAAIAVADDGQFVPWSELDSTAVYIRTDDHLDIGLLPGEDIRGAFIADPNYIVHYVRSAATHVDIKASGAVNSRRLTIITDQRAYHLTIASGPGPTSPFVQFFRRRPVVYAAATLAPKPTLATLAACPFYDGFSQRGNGLSRFSVAWACRIHGLTYVTMNPVAGDLPPIYVVEDGQDQVISNPAFARGQYVLDGMHKHLAFRLDTNRKPLRLDVIFNAPPRAEETPLIVGAPTAAPSLQANRNAKGDHDER